MQRKRVVQLGLVLMALGLSGAAAAFGPVVRGKARAQAERRGATLEIGAVRPGWGRVWLRDVTVRVPDVPALELRVDSIEVQVGAGLAPRAVRVHGGTARLHGEASEVIEQIRAWRGKQRSDGGGGSRLGVSADGVSVVWSELDAGGQPLELWGVRYTRDGDQETLGADLGRGRWHGVSAEVRHASLELGRRDGHRVLKRLTAEGVSASVDLDSADVKRVVDKSAAIPVRHESPAVDGKKPKPKSGARLARFIDEKRGERVRAGLGRLAALASDVLPPAGELDLAGVGLRLLRGGDTLNVGPARFHVLRGEHGISFQVAPAPSAEHALRLSLELPEGAGEVKASIAGGPVSLADLGVQEGDFGLKDVSKATLEAQGTATLSAKGDELSWSGKGKLAGVSIEKSWLAPQRVRGISVGLRGKGNIAVDGKRLHIDDGELAFGSVKVSVRGDLEQTREYQKLQLDGGVPLASCQAMLESIPDGLAPLLSGMRASGTFSLTGRAEIDTRDLSKMVTSWAVANECRITDVPLAVSPRKFSTTSTREVLDANGRPVQVPFGPGTATWVPRQAISRHMETAILICEDAGFFRHRGFDQEAIRNSIKMNVEAGRFVRGASTVSMQLAKNLYLSRQKTVSRKLQEAVLTLLLEQELSKDQILELYLNAIEFGPGLYGVGPAAAYYFNTTASHLSLGQALYLASILPNPKRQYFGADGAVTPGWSGYLRKLMQIAFKIHRIDEQELEEALSEQVTFKVPYSPRVPVEGEPEAPAGEQPEPTFQTEQQGY